MQKEATTYMQSKSSLLLAGYLLLVLHGWLPHVHSLAAAALPQLGATTHQHHTEDEPWYMQLYNSLASASHPDTLDDQRGWLGDSNGWQALMLALAGLPVLLLLIHWPPATVQSVAIRVQVLPPLSRQWHSPPVFNRPPPSRRW